MDMCCVLMGDAVKIDDMLVRAIQNALAIPVAEKCVYLCPTAAQILEQTTTRCRYLVQMVQPADGFAAANSMDCLKHDNHRDTAYFRRKVLYPAPRNHWSLDRN